MILNKQNVREKSRNHLTILPNLNVNYIMLDKCIRCKIVKLILRDDPLYGCSSCVPFFSSSYLLDCFRL